ncbi:MAG TPA: HAMP domain-containing protein, partial [Acetobacteraceae bacterium]
MLDRLSSDIILKSILAVLASVAIISLGTRVWDSWQQLGAATQAERVAAVSGQAFTALVNIRTDRSSTSRTWAQDGDLTPDVKSYLSGIRDTEMPAIRATLTLIDEIPIAGADTLVPELRQLSDKLAALQTEYWAGMARPKAERRTKLADEYMQAGLALQTNLEKLSAGLFSVIKAKDPFIDQMMEVKQLAWQARNLAGEASLIISNGLAARKVPADAMQKYAGFVGGTNATWAAIEGVITGIALPAQFDESIAAAKNTFFAPDYLATRDRLLNQLLNGDKPEMTADQWSPYTVPKLGLMLTVADAALKQAKDHAVAIQSATMVRLAWQLALLVGAVLLSFGSILLVTRRITTPLHTLRDSMLKLAGGDLSAEAPFTDRHDEIGALA